MRLLTSLVLASVSIVAWADDGDIQRELASLRKLKQQIESQIEVLESQASAKTGPAAEADKQDDARSVSDIFAELGLIVRDVHADELVFRFRDAVAVMHVRPGSDAAKLGLSPGDMILGSDRWPTTGKKLELLIEHPRPSMFYLRSGDEGGSGVVVRP